MSVGSHQFGSSTGPLTDRYARKWFTNLAENMEKVVKAYIEVNGEPEDYSIFHTAKKGNIGLEVSAHVRKSPNGLVFMFVLYVDKHKYEQWAREHTYLMEGLLSFRIGPVIWAHPGRNFATFTRGGVTQQRSTNIWDMEHGFLGEDRMETFNLFKGTVRVEALRNKHAGPDDSAWIVNRTR